MYLFIYFFCSEGILSSPQQCCYSVIQSNQTQLTQCQVCWFVSKKSKWCRLGNQHGLAVSLSFYIFLVFLIDVFKLFFIYSWILISTQTHQSTCYGDLSWIQKAGKQLFWLLLKLLSRYSNVAWERGGKNNDNTHIHTVVELYGDWELESFDVNRKHS